MRQDPFLNVLFYPKFIKSVTKLSQLTDICKGNNLQESFEQFEGLGLSSIATHVRILFHFFEKANTGQIKMVNVNYKKWPHLTILLF